MRPEKCDTCRGLGVTDESDYPDQQSDVPMELVAPKREICLDCKGTGKSLSSGFVKQMRHNRYSVE